MEEMTKRRPGRPVKERMPEEFARTEVRLSPEMHHRVRIAAAVDAVGMGEWIRRAIERELDAR